MILAKALPVWEEIYICGERLGGLSLTLALVVSESRAVRELCVFHE